MRMRMRYDCDCDENKLDVHRESDDVGYPVHGLADAVIDSRLTAGRAGVTSRDHT